ncbi:putative late blight resistance protein homolog R1A-10 [Henckelia pumila]|uniref:putative late blight resistance protein homolog R1A-10 n=1 Tax=Henckelia pumila TaxID=405737 RepID=UPI003C6EA071
MVYQNLIRRRYLIVIDDIWSNEAWDDLKMIFPDDGNRSRILITTRLSDVVIHSGSTCANSLHQMKFLNEDQSWKLLRERVFGPKSCPPQLMKIGKKIARNCGGLPLTIVVIAGLLLSTKEESWEAVSENISLAEPAIAMHCAKILYMSYDWLPLRLKPCFLYISAFPEDSKIDVCKLIKLWIAEGFLSKPDNDRSSKCLEDVGEMYLEEFVKRHLITMGEKGLDGKLKIVGVHDLLREICITKAEEERFLRPIYISEMNVQK